MAAEQRRRYRCGGGRERGGRRARRAARRAVVRAARVLPRRGSPERSRRLRDGRRGLARLVGDARPARSTGSSPGRRCSTTQIRRFTSGSSAARSTSPTTAWTATSRRAAAAALPSTGAARRAPSATSRTPSCSRTSSAWPTLCKDSRRAEGRRRRDLPADDPRGRRRDARLRAYRRRAQRRLRRLLGRGGTRADGVLRRQAPDHRRRRGPQGQTRCPSRRPSTR